MRTLFVGLLLGVGLSALVWWYYAPPLNPSPLCQELSYRLDNGAWAETSGYQSFTDGRVMVVALFCHHVEWYIDGQRIESGMFSGTERDWLDCKARKMFKPRIERANQKEAEAERQKGMRAAERLRCPVAPRR